MEELYDNLMYSSDYDSFIEYYSYVRESICSKRVVAEYPARNRNIHRLAYAYLEELQEIEHSTSIRFAVEIERCFCSLEKHYEETYADRVAEAKEYLFKIESSRINTMEMLFEAEEIDAETKALLDEPKSII